MTADLHALLDTDPAAGLRGVAALMRARAEAATQGPWEATPGAFGDPCGGPDHMRVVTSGWSGAYDAEKTVARLEYERQGGDDAAHIAAADPPFVLAVADWLEAEAGKQTPTSHLAVTFDGTPMFPVDPQAIATARAYLGTP